MPFAAGIEHARVDSATVIAHLYPEEAARIFYFHLDAAGPRVQKSVYHGLAANAVGFIADQRA